MKKLKKSLSVFLAVLMFFSLFSCATTVFAEDYSEYVKTKAYQEKLLTETVDAESEQSEILYEVEEKRDEYSKTYKRADGSYTAVVSSTPIHTYENGEWKEINNTLEANGGLIKNAEGIYDIEFPETLSENDKITVSNGEETLSFSVNEISESNGVVAQKENIDIITDDLSKAVSQIIYEAVDTDTDIQYIVSAETVKENIIVYNPESLKDTYSFDIEKGNLTAVLDDSNNLTFKNEKKEIVFTIPAPVMTDANNAVSYDIDVKVENADKSVLTLIYTPSKDWLNGNDRAYPVVIDPVIEMESARGTYIEDTIILDVSDDSEDESQNYANSPLGLVADISSTNDSGETEFTRAEMLVKLNMAAFEGFNQTDFAVTDVNYISYGTVIGGNILAKAINGSWDSTEITYEDVYPSDGSAPVITYEDKIIDYYTGISEDDKDDGLTVCLNITELFNEWLSGKRENNGFAIVAGDTSVIAGLVIDGYSESSSGKKTYCDSYCSIDYVDASSYNENFQYLTQEIGRAGTVNVNTFTRGLSLSRSDLFMDGLRSPVSIDFNYNCALESFINMYLALANASEPLEDEIRFPYGNNWMPSYFQWLFELMPGQYLFFTGEGTLAVFNLKEETVTDEETGESTTTVTFEEDERGDTGYTLELIDQQGDVTPENMKITLPGGEISYFDESGFASKICESVPNSDGTYDKIIISYSEENPFEIDSVTDGAGRIYDFVYDEENFLLTQITCLTADRSRIKAGTTDVDLKVNYSYNENRELTGVTYADGKSVSYTYDVNGNLIKAQNIDNYNIQYTYDSLGKVTNIAEYADTTAGNSIHLTELSNRQVKVTDAYSGTEIYQFGKDGKLHYTFDENGNYYKSDYAPSNDENVYSSYDWKISSQNLLKNPSFEENLTLNTETAKHWTSSFTRVEDETAVMGEYVYKISSETAVTKYLEQTVEVENIEEYTFSAYVKSETVGMLSLKITAVDESGTVDDTVAIQTVESAEEWSRVSVTYTPDDFEVAEVTVGIGFNNNCGSYYVDCVQLEGGNGTAEYNYIENGGFNYGSDCWSNIAVTNDILLSESVKAVKLSGGLPYYEENIDGTYTLNNSISATTQNVRINGKKGDIYSVGGWFKGLFDDNYVNPLVTTEYSEITEQLTNSSAQIKVTYAYTDTVTQTDEEGNGTQVEQTVTENFVVDFAPHNENWQYAVDSFALKGDTESVDITVMTKNIPSDSYATGIELTLDNEAIYLEDEEASQVEEDVSTETESSTEEIEITECLCEDCEEYDCACRCLSESVCTCIQCKRQSSIETVSEDGKTVTTKSYDGESYMQSTVGYSDDLNYISSEIDSNGISAEYAYNNSGTRTSYTDGMQNVSTYSSNAVGYLTLAETNVTGLTDNALKMSINYIYDGDLLTTVNAGNVQYTYTYDRWGQLNSVGVDGETLICYTYGSKENRTRILKITFGSSEKIGFTLKYSYNSDGNIYKVEKYNYFNGEKNSVVYQYFYDNLSNLIAIEDNGTGHYIEYTDCGVVIKNKQTGSVIYESKDITPETDDSEEAEENQPVSITEETANGVTYTHNIYDSSYDAETGKTTEYEAVTGGKTICTKTVSDWFGRNEAVTVVTKDPTDTETTNYASITSQYNYKTTGDVTTNLISSLNNSFGSSSYINYSYTYDANGRITGITSASDVASLNSSTEYVYDEAGQLIKEIASNVITEYAYDSKGNITSRKVGSANPVTFTYDVNTWEDRLTSYNGQTIVYDSIGNPTTYLGATLTWRGRELESYTKGTKQISYSYDVDGMRYQKAVKTDGVETARYDYVYSEGTLILITYTDSAGSTTARFIYDSWGELRGFILNNAAAYLYLKNAQGDITGIVNENGEIILSYSYDVWGNVTFSATSISNMLLAVTLSSVNPFTYRGYCYDFDIGMYYLQSRYYDPQICRFINADSTDYLGATGSLLSYNLFAYCENDPMGMLDYNGYAASGFPNTTDKNKIINTCIKTFESSSNKKLFSNSYSKINCCWNYSCYSIVYYSSGKNKGLCYIYYTDNLSPKVLNQPHSKRLVGRVICLTVSEWKAYIVARHENWYFKCKKAIEKLIGEDGFDLLLDWIQLVAENADLPYIQCGSMILSYACQVYEYYKDKFNAKFDNYVKRFINNAPSSKWLYAVVISVTSYSYEYNRRYYAWRKMSTITAY